MRIKKGDTVKVLSGNDKGKTGEVLEVMPKTEKIIVKGINIRKKSVKPRKQGEEGGIIPSEHSIHSSKVAVVCPKCQKATRIGYTVEKDEKALMKKFNYKSVMEVPKLEKIVINIGLGDTKENPKELENAVNDLAQITGQKPIVTKSKKAIAAFKLRAGIPIGCKVTLRNDKMYDFANKLFNVALPRVRDFRGVSTNSFDGRGNYSMGIKEQLIFPEIEYDKVDKIRGMDIIFVTTAKTDEEARELLTLLGMPFKN